MDNDGHFPFKRGYTRYESQYTAFFFRYERIIRSYDRKVGHLLSHSYFPFVSYKNRSSSRFEQNREYKRRHFWGTYGKLTLYGNTYNTR